MNTILRTQLSGVARRPSRMLLTGLAVLVASFVVFATVLAQQITERSVLDGLSGTPEAVDLVVRDGAITDKQLAAITALPGVSRTAARTAIGAQFGGQYLNLTADPGSGPLALVTPTEGRYPSAAGEIAVTPRTVQLLGLTVGSTATVDPGTGKKVPLTVVGVVEPPQDFGYDAYAPAGTVTGLVPDPYLQQVDIDLDGGADLDRVSAAVSAIFAGVKQDERPDVATGADVRLAEARSRAAQIDQVFAVVGMFVAIAVAAAGLIAASTFRIVFAQRMRQLALLRAVGAGRGAMFRALAAEGALTGLLTGTVGVLAALAAGHAVPAVLRGFGWKVLGPGLPVLPAIGTVLLAMVISVVAVLAPAISASRVAPLEALRAAAGTGARTGIGALRWAAGLLPLAGAVALAGYVFANLPGPDAENYDAESMLLAVVASGALAFIALIALGPVLVRPVLAVAGWPLRRFGPVGRLAIGGVGGSARRAAAVSVVVALGVTLTAGVLVGGASIRVLGDRELAASAPADFELTGGAGVTLPAGFVEKAKASGELTRVVSYRRIATAKVGQLEDLAVTDLDMAALPRLRDLDVKHGSVDDLGPGKAVLAGYVADLAGLGVGDRVAVTSKGKKAELTVAAVLGDDAPLHTGLLVAPADLTALGVGPAASGVLADAAHDGDSGRTEGLRAMRAVSAGNPDFAVNVLADQRDELNASLTALLAIALGLIGLTVLIAVVGVGATTALSVVERVRESGLLRAIGMSRAGLRAMLTAESGLYGVIGAVLGLLLGVPYAWLAIQAIGVNAPLAIPVWQLAGAFLVLVALTALAGVLPARRAAKVSPVTALGTE
ncbi:putative ABC transport system permease protein [Actinoplanes octamycinicus]|uniref:Putative ABC transport system permease protein n=1 Tax=Actinoplanes octamycinicus TaxID=135948 RepID=A0A7W7H5G2_9ACTN|nr:FtsX-like permease family protein [Actinoplanes octamycinicus]MBB4744351.1 putative ABC transport system permease protein [Actinoplanes octamycinicus]GIE56688.1 ABC transporter substrate-binding protein [Actinoplanes octamycinicus]